MSQPPSSSSPVSVGSLLASLLKPQPSATDTKASTLGNPSPSASEDGRPRTPGVAAQANVAAAPGGVTS